MVILVNFRNKSQWKLLSRSGYMHGSTRTTYKAFIPGIYRKQYHIRQVLSFLGEISPGLVRKYAWFNQYHLQDLYAWHLQQTILYQTGPVIFRRNKSWISQALVNTWFIPVKIPGVERTLSKTAISPVKKFAVRGHLNYIYSLLNYFSQLKNWLKYYHHNDRRNPPFRQC